MAGLAAAPCGLRARDVARCIHHSGGGHGPHAVVAMNAARGPGQGGQSTDESTSSAGSIWHGGAVPMLNEFPCTVMRLDTP